MLVCSFFVFSNYAKAACDPGSVERDDVLVVVNSNSNDSIEVGEDYCEQRNLNPANVVHVNVPAGYYMSFEQFALLRDQLIKFMLENTLQNGAVPVTCPSPTEGGLYNTTYFCPETTSLLRNNTKIRYIVFTKDVPALFQNTDSSLADAGISSTDNYLRIILLNHIASDTRLYHSLRSRAFADGSGMRTIVPAVDREIIVGRIDGLSKDSAMQLVRRAKQAEQDGIFGKLIGSNFGRVAGGSDDTLGMSWREWTSAYATASDKVYEGWQYQHAPIGSLLGASESGLSFQDDASCGLTYLRGESVPQSCVVRLTSGGTDPLWTNSKGIVNDPFPGNSSGQIDRVDNPIVYLGYLDGQQTLGNYNNVLNWRESQDCQKECADDDVACKAKSVDFYREINTDCVRVANGFIGYNFQSFPVALLAGWPTGWYHTSNNSSDKWGHVGGTFQHLWFPKVINEVGIGFDDDFALRFDNRQSSNDNGCYGSEGIAGAPDLACNLEKVVNINNKIDFSTQTIAPTPQMVTVKFKYKTTGTYAAGSSTARLNVRLFVREETYNDGVIIINSSNQVDYGSQAAATFSTDGTTNSPDSNSLCDGQPAVNGWCDASATFPLNPSLHIHPNLEYDGYKFRITANRRLQGEIIVDNFEILEDGVPISEALINPSFSGGHRQTAGGDHAVTFLNRLNGTAFWGSVSHHDSLGHSFDTHPMETFVYFMRGLPLGDAVWFAEIHNSGMLIGDPLYNPVAIHMHYLNESGAYAERPTNYIHFTPGNVIPLSGDVVNGSNRVGNTTYSVDYCAGEDFFACEPNDWIPISSIQNKAVAGDGYDEAFGSWVVPATQGDYVLRLSVTVANPDNGLTQTFHDYQTVHLFPGSLDDDGDGFDFDTEFSQGTNPWLNEDADNDGLPDAWEVFHGLNITIDNSTEDFDNDGAVNYIEYLRGTSPSDTGDSPNFVTLLVDPINGVDDENSPFASYPAALAVADYGDTIALSSGNYSDVVSLERSIHLTGPLDRSAIIQLGGFLSADNNRVTEYSNLTFVSSTDSGLHLSSGDYRLKNIVFMSSRLAVGNFVDIFGGVSWGPETVELENVLIHDASNGIEILHGPTLISVSNSTISNNTNGIIVEDPSTVFINNSIIYGNTVNINDAATTISSSIIGDDRFHRINGNYNIDPKFVDAANGDYHLTPQSFGVATASPNSESLYQPRAVFSRANRGFYSNTSGATVGADSDGDFMPDGWEIFAGLNPYIADGLVDSDGDGLLNIDEYRGDSLPKDALSRSYQSYYVVNPQSEGNALAVSTAEENSIRFQNFIYNLPVNQVYSLPASRISTGAKITCAAACSFGSTVNNSDAPIPENFAGLEFVIPHYRDNHYYHILSPFSSANVSISTESDQDYVVAKGEVLTVAAGIDNSISGIVRADVPILVFHSAELNGSLRDAHPVPPPSLRLYGIRSTVSIVGALEDDTTVNIYTSNGETSTVSLNSGERYSMNVGSNDTQGRGVVQTIFANKPIAAVQGADSDGTETTAFLATHQLLTDAILPVDAQYLAVACPHPNTVITLDDASDTEHQFCSGTSSQAGKAYFGSASNGANIKAGTKLSSNKPIYVIYEESVQNDESHLFGNLQPQVSYFIIDPRQVGQDLLVTSLTDINQLSVNGWITTLNEGESAVVPASEITNGAEVRGTGEFSPVTERSGTDMAVPESFASTRFVIPHSRYEQHFMLLSPYGDTQVTIDNGSPQTLSITQGSVIDYNAGSDNTTSSVIESDLPIVVMSRSIDTANGGVYDTYAVPPASTLIFGIRSTAAYVGALEDNTTVHVYTNDSLAATTYTMSKGERLSIGVGSNTSQGEGSAIRISGNKPITAIQVADGDGGEATAFQPHTAFSNFYIVPVNAQYISVVCLSSGTVKLLDDGIETEQSCSGQVARKAYFGSSANGVNISAGATLSSDTTFMVVYEPADTDDEQNLHGKSLSSYDATTLPTISSMLISEAAVGESGGVTGSNLCIYQCLYFTPSEVKAYVNGVEATVVYARDDVLVFTVPEGATSGKVRIVTPAGEVTSQDDFVVLQPGS